MLFYSRTCAPSIKCSRGFTLLEVLMTLGLISVLAMLTWPALSYFNQKAEARRMEALTVQVLQKANLAALSIGKAVMVCLSEDGVNCAVSRAKYWLSFYDTAGDGVMHDDASLLQRLPIPANKIRWKINTMSAKQGGIVFSPETVGNATISAYLASKEMPLFVLTVSRLGRVRERMAVTL